MSDHLIRAVMPSTHHMVINLSAPISLLPHTIFCPHLPPLRLHVLAFVSSPSPPPHQPFVCLFTSFMQHLFLYLFTIFQRMALVFIIIVLSLAGAMVDSASNITSCDAPLSNTTCQQGSCLQPPCTMHCGLTTPYDTCEQRCNANSCDSLKCNASVRCLQQCNDGNCISMTCDATNCFQSCNRGNCSLMTCSENARNASTCEQSSMTAEMICGNDICTQNCDAGNCRMICSSSVKQCTQNCNVGNCFYMCEAQTCYLNCEGGGNCTNIKSSTSKPTTESGGGTLQMKASVGLGLVFAVVSFM